MVKLWNEVLEKTRDKCINESGVDRAAVMNVLDTGNFPNEPKFKCYVKCQNVVHGFINEKGDFNIEKFQKLIGPNGWQEVSEKCLVLEGEDLCARSYNVTKCTYNAVKSTFLA